MRTANSSTSQWGTAKTWQLQNESLGSVVQTIVAIHKEEKSHLYIQLGNGGLLKYLEEQLVF